MNAKISTAIAVSTLVAGLALAGFGCASPDVNPRTPRPDTGYVDIYDNEDAGIAWDIGCFDNATGQFNIVYSELYPPEHGILRLAFPPGTLRLRVNCLDRVIQEAAVLDVTVHDTQITPVHVTLVPMGVAQVQTSTEQWGPTMQGRYGRNNKLGSYETKTFRVSAEPQEPASYQPKEQMSYAPSPK